MYVPVESLLTQLELRYAQTVLLVDTLPMKGARGSMIALIVQPAFIMTWAGIGTAKIVQLAGALLPLLRLITDTLQCATDAALESTRPLDRPTAPLAA